MRRLKKFGLLAMALACAGLMAPVAGAATIIDLFDSSNGSVLDETARGALDPPGPATGVSEVNGAPAPVLDAAILGGYRDLFVDLGNNHDEVKLTVNNGAAFDSQSPTSAPTLMAPTVAHITWDGDSTSGNLDTASFLADLSLENGFYLTSNDTVAANRLINIEVWDTVGNRAYRDLTLVAGDSAHYLSFASMFDFALVDFSQVGAIRMNFLTDDIRINTFTAVVPVPPAVGLGLLGMMVVGGLRRRKKASAA